MPSILFNRLWGLNLDPLPTKLRPLFQIAFCFFMSKTVSLCTFSCPGILCRSPDLELVEVHLPLPHECVPLQPCWCKYPFFIFELPLLQYISPPLKTQ